MNKRSYCISRVSTINRNKLLNYYTNVPPLYFLHHHCTFSFCTQINAPKNKEKHYILTYIIKVDDISKYLSLSINRQKPNETLKDMTTVCLTERRPFRF